MVSHSTRLGYAQPVVEAHSEIRKTPVDTDLQRVVTHKLQVEPAAILRSYVDYFGTHVAYFNLLESHTALVIEAELVVETTDAIHCGPREPKEPEDGRHWSQRLAEFLHWSPGVPYLSKYAEIPHRVSLDLQEDDFLDALRELANAFSSRFRYDPEATDVHSSPAVLFEVGGGVCQDLAHAILGVLRLAGVPSRYVSGYVYDPVSEEEGDAVLGSSTSHAWVQAWHPTLGWVGIDPTNDKLVDWQYVRIATGRDYTDVQPLRGFFVGAWEQTLDVDVSVKRIG